MGKLRIIMPLPFKSFSTFDVPTWYFDDTSCLETIYDEDFSAFYRDELDEFYKAAIDVRTSCIYVQEIKEKDFEEIARRTAIQFKYVLNGFSLDKSIAIPFAGLVEFEDKAHIQKILDLEPSTNLHSLRKKEFKIRPETEPATVSDFYKIVSKCCTKNKTLLFTLDRFNSSLIRDNFQDRVVDITISLESLISGKDELRFKFALYNSFISESSAEDRWKAFELFSALYDARSGIVHGENNSKANQKVAENWDEIVKNARASLNYHLLYLNQKSRESWDEHLKHLVFGKTVRIVEQTGEVQ